MNLMNKQAMNLLREYRLTGKHTAEVLSAIEAEIRADIEREAIERLLNETDDDEAYAREAKDSKAANELNRRGHWLSSKLPPAAKEE